MRIAVFDNTAIPDIASGPGAPAHFSTPTIAGLRAMGHEVTVHGAFDPAVADDADIVWTEWANEDAIEAAAYGCRRLIVRMRGYDVWGPLDLLRRQSVGAMVYESVWMRELAWKRFPPLREIPSHVIPAGVDLQRFTFKPRAPGKIVALVARTLADKGYQLAFEWARRRPDITLHVTTALAEANPRFARYLAHATPSNVHIHESVETASWLDAIDANYLLDASVWETLGYTIVEAMALGIRPLVHNRPGSEMLWPDLARWTSLDDLDRLLELPYDTYAYRKRAEQDFDAQKQTAKFADVLFSAPSTAFSPRQRYSALALAIQKEIREERPHAVDDSLTRFRHDTRTQPHFAAIRANLAQAEAVAYFNLGHVEQARVWALRAMQSGPSAASFALLGEVHWEQQEYEAAQQWYEAACQLDAQYWPRLEELRQEASADDVTFVETVDTSDRALILQTAPRIEATLARTLKSLQDAGLQHWRGPRILVCDGPSVAVPGWTTARASKDESCIGSAQTMLFALREAMRMGVRDVTYFEDDVVLAKNALGYISRANTGRYDFVSWYSGVLSPFKSARPIFARSRLEGFARSIAVTIPARTIEKVLNSPVVKSWSARHGGDMIFGQALPTAVCAIHYPSIVDHIGAVSAVGNCGLRDSPTFIGEDVDPRTLTD